MTKKRRYLNLRMKMLLVTLLALAGAAGIYYLSDLAINAGIDRWYMTDSRVAQRNEAQAERLQTFAQEHQIKASDAQALEDWSKENYAYALIMADDGTALEVGWWGLCAWTEVEQPEEFLQTYDGELRSIEFADGAHWVLTEDYSDYRLYNSIAVVSYGLASLFVLLVVLIYQSQTTHRMSALSKQTQKVSAGDLQHKIAVKGHDELADVAENVNRMRSAIIEQMRSEQLAWQANVDLIKSMSHDVRNPLTTLMGYLELAKEHEGLPEEVQEYLQISSSKAQQLKDLTEEMFQYFLVFGAPDLQLNLERMDAAAVLNQMLGEHLVELEHNGWQVQKKWLHDAGSICVDALQLNRVFDNLFSNIKKYADPDKPVFVRAEQEKNRVRICLINEINSTANQRESNGIGLKTCEKIIGKMGGVFQTTAGKQRFTAVINLPLAAEPCPEEDNA